MAGTTSRLALAAALLLACSRPVGQTGGEGSLPSPGQPAPAGGEGKAGGEGDAGAAPVAPPDAAPASPYTPFARIDAASPAALEIPRTGAEQPLLVLVQVGSYECEHSRRAEPEVERILAKLPETARFYLHNPLPGHRQGYLLALAAVAAQRQGRFWEMHRLLASGGPAVNEDQLLAMARKVGLDVPLFLKDMKREQLKEQVERNRILAAALGLSGTPGFLVNGRPVVGWPGAERFAGLLAEELEAARKLRGKGMAVAELHLALAGSYRPYATVIAEGVKWDQTVPAPAVPPAEWTRYRVPREPADLVLGPAAAELVAVYYLDPLCPHSARAWSQARELVLAHGDALAVVVKLNPALSRPDSLAAADLCWSLPTQDARRAFLDALFGGQEPTVARAAACPGPDDCPPLVPGSERFRRRLDAVKLEAVALGAVGTPTLFLNGLVRRGFQERERLQELLAQELEVVRELQGRGVPREELYAHLTGRGAVLSLVDAAAPMASPEPALRLGEATAPVQMVVTWEFGSPFCRNLWGHLARLRADLREELAVALLPVLGADGEGQLRLALTVHCLFQLGAGEGAMEALAERTAASSPEELERLVAALGQSPEQVARCVEGAAAAGMAAQWREAAGTEGAPVLFLNGRRVRAPAGLDYYSVLAAIRQVRP